MSVVYLLNIDLKFIEKYVKRCKVVVFCTVFFSKELSCESGPYICEVGNIDDISEMTPMLGTEMLRIIFMLYFTHLLQKVRRNRVWGILILHL